ncbi:YdeI/OmpD-associated family protein [Sporosarcina saromensis]|uniref:YdeI/OmpD-associated family protein n=1 Tax=Sporosarcina saromensis TaxID=359365 RepID=A0ABU4G8K5_9BACL|nr:YdeI/OmpD-associated family protein [Sporosarcina saromensis]MDW0112712.1 YdeI/OmpD-associated family protein [Sporosarcina saromensis]
MNSTKTIIEKLKLDKYEQIAVIHSPEDLVEEFAAITYDDRVLKDKYNCLFVFIYNLEEFKREIRVVIEKSLLENKGYLFFAYPKKGNKQYDSFIDRDVFYNELQVDEDGYVDGSDLKFSRMVSLNDVFTVVGLKCEQKKTKTKSAKASQCVDDYIDRIEDIRRHLQTNEEILPIYDALTFGYQKDWARYVYSAKRQETQEKRLAEMEIILAEGYKSKDLYRQNRK